MKRFLVLLLALCMTFSLFACGKPSDTKQPDATQSESGKDTTNPTKKDETPSNTTPDNEQNDTMTEEMFNDPNFEDVVLVDDDHSYIVVTGVHPDDERGCVVDIVMKNRVQRKLLHKVAMPTINGVHVSGTYSENGVDLETGWVFLTGNEEKYSELVLWTEDLVRNNITKYTNVQFNFRAETDAPQHEVVQFTNVMAQIFPYGEEADAQYDYIVKEGDTVVADEETFKCVVQDKYEDADGNTIITLCIINKSEYGLFVTTDNELINGCEINPYFAVSVNPNAIRFEQMKFTKSTLSKNDISDVTDIKFILNVAKEGRDEVFYFTENCEATFN